MSARRDFLEYLPFVVGVAFHGLHEVSHQIVTSLELNVDIRPRPRRTILQPNEPVEDDARPPEDDDEPEHNPHHDASFYSEDQPKRWIECVLTIRCTGVRASSPSCATARWVSFT